MHSFDFEDLRPKKSSCDAIAFFVTKAVWPRKLSTNFLTFWLLWLLLFHFMLDPDLNLDPDWNAFGSGSAMAGVSIRIGRARNLFRGWFFAEYDCHYYKKVPGIDYIRYFATVFSVRVPDPAFHSYADPDSDPTLQQSDTYLRPLAYRPCRAPFCASNSKHPL